MFILYKKPLGAKAKKALLFDSPLYDERFSQQTIMYFHLSPQ